MMSGTIMSSISIFCYGTLMSPNVLARVLFNKRDLPSNSPLSLTPATLHNHSRSRLIDESYPAIVKSEGSSVAGVLVSELTPAQVKTLDAFEGDEYERQKVQVVNENGQAVDAWCYIWVDRLDRLTGVDWDFDEFMQNRFKTWIEGEMSAME
ncbi:AIG2-like family-domain-containing protein [Myxozyma melibiosi]|uniref:Putative gamma-glutamylcyclotransferase n=1 Tax=Myxozyma melibiosi TaxID=54550 RepID=A0ABR1F3C8_9ASCO